jgi:hypothetical protein
MKCKCEGKKCKCTDKKPIDSNVGGHGNLVMNKKGHLIYPKTGKRLVVGELKTAIKDIVKQVMKELDDESIKEISGVGGGNAGGGAIGGMAFNVPDAFAAGGGTKKYRGKYNKNYDVPAHALPGKGIKLGKTGHVSKRGHELASKTFQGGKVMDEKNN